MDNEKNLIDAFLLKLNTIWVYFLYIIVGVMAKFGLEMAKGVKMTWVQVFISISSAIFVGWCATYYCMRYAPNWAGIIVPTCTLMSKEITSWVVTRKVKDLLTYFQDWIKK